MQWLLLSHFSTDELECHHGISISGVIAAIPNNGIATAGVGHDTRVAMYNVASSCGTGSPASGFSRAVQDGRNIINYSWQGNTEPGNTLSISAVQSYVDNGGVLVTAAGDNNHTTIAQIDGVINVGICEWNEGIGWNHRGYLEPGIEDKEIDIYVYPNLMRLIEYDGCDTSNFGSSIAAPVVSATVALMRSVNENLSSAEIECIIKMSATRDIAEAPADAFAKALNIGAAVEMAQVWPNIEMGDKLDLEGEQTISNLTSNGNVYIKKGADITITGSLTLAHDNIFVYVEKGARLRIDGAVVGPGSCNTYWRGFIVEGNSARQQPDPETTFLDPDDAGILILNNATINDAVNAVSMNPGQNSKLFGGLVIATSTQFNDNGRSFEFMRYQLGETSRITSCKFTDNTKHVITAWRSDGLVIENDTFLLYQDDAIFNATSAFTARNNRFIGSGSPNSLDWLYRNIGIDINNGSMLATNYVVENNFFTGNHFAVKFEGTDNQSRFTLNTMTGNDFGIDAQGTDHFEVYGNSTASEYLGILVHNSGTADNIVQENLIGAAENGLHIVNQNDQLLFLRNCFAAMPNLGSSTDIEIVRSESPIVSVDPQQFLIAGPLEMAADNCFQDFTKDIVNGATVSLQGQDDPNPGEPDPNDPNYIAPGLFEYGTDETLSSSDCSVAKEDDLFEALDAESVFDPCLDGGFTGATSGSPTYITPTYCTPENNIMGLYQQEADIREQIADLESQFSLSYAEVVLLRKLKRCSSRIGTRIVEKLIDSRDIRGLSNYVGQTAGPSVRISSISQLIDQDLLHEASNLLSDISDISQDWEQYRYSQEILIRLLANFEEFIISQSEKNQLLEYARTRHIYSPFIRGVYAEVFGESIILENKITNVSGVKRSDDEITENLIAVYPNPASNLVSVEAREVISAITVYTTSGKTMYQTSQLDSNRHDIDVSDFPKGMLFIEIINLHGESELHKLLKL